MISNRYIELFNLITEIPLSHENQIISKEIN